jgi:hypothetical protein
MAGTCSGHLLLALTLPAVSLPGQHVFFVMADDVIGEVVHAADMPTIAGFRARTAERKSA